MLNHIIEGLLFQKRPRVYRIAVPAQAESKNAVMRSYYRVEKVMEYFKDARVIEISRKGAGIRYRRSDGIQGSGSQGQDNVLQG